MYRLECASKLIAAAPRVKIDINKVLDFWFADTIGSSAAFASRSEIWFGEADPEFDEQIETQFASCIEPVFAGEAAQHEESARSMLALILILDQFPRNVYRGTARAFQFDGEALRLCLKAISRQYSQQLHFAEQVFMFLPLQHAEDRQMQNQSVQMFAQLIAAAADDPVLLQAAESSLEFARLHRDIVHTYGRFPHRNAILGRASTQLEIDYLSSGAETFGQSADVAGGEPSE